MEEFLFSVPIPPGMQRKKLYFTINEPSTIVTAKRNSPILPVGNRCRWGRVNICFNFCLIGQISGLFVCSDYEGALNNRKCLKITSHGRRNRMENKNSAHLHTCVLSKLLNATQNTYPAPVCQKLQCFLCHG